MTPADIFRPPGAALAAADIFQEIEQRKRRLEDAEGAMLSFRKFIPLAWPVAEPAKAFLPNWHADAIADHMQAVAEGQIRKLLITVPPGCAKSLLVSVMFPAWMWTPKRNPAWRATFASYAAELSTDLSVKCRNLLKSPWYKDSFRPKWKFTTDQDVKSYFKNSASGHRFATSVGAAATGFRGDFIGIDDAIKAGDRNSEAKLQEVIDWFDNEIFNRLNDPATGSKVIIMQRLADRDLAGHVLRGGGWEHLLIPMEYDPSRSKVTVIGWSDPRKEKDELMFPALFPRMVVDEFKQDGGRFSAQYQQQPSVAGGGIVRSDWWQFWQPAGANLPPVRVKLRNGDVEERRAVELPDQFDVEVSSLDCAFKDLKTSDFVAGLVVGVRGANRYIKDSVHERLDLPGTIAAVRRMAGLHPKAFTKLVEDKANGPAVMQSLKHEISGLTEVNPQGTKVGRATAATPELRAGNWFLPHPLIAPWVGNPENPTEAGFLAETIAFPLGDHDDWVDAWSMAANWIQSESGNRILTASEKDIRIEPLEIGAKWPRLYGLSVTWNEVGAVWLCRRPETGEHFLYAEHAAPAGDPARHAAEILKQGDWIPGFMHASSQGRDEKDGQALATKYRQMGLKHLMTVMDNTITEIADMQDALRSGKLKVCGDMARFFDQLRMFRRENSTRGDASGKLPTYNAGVVYAALVAWKHREKAKAPIEAPPPRETQYRNGPASQTWMG